jgi:hypothetical protein
MRKPKTSKKLALASALGAINDRVTFLSLRTGTLRGVGYAIPPRVMCGSEVRLCVSERGMSWCNRYARAS